MRYPLLLIVLLVTCLVSQAQDYRISFAIAEQSISPDSIQVKNRNQNRELTLKGDEVLHLVQHITAKLYPNPMRGRARIDYYNPGAGMVLIEINDIAGKTLVSESETG